MSSIQPQRITQIQDLRRLKALDGDANGKISLAEVKQQIDTDNDGSLSDAELDQVALKNSAIRLELQQKYAKGSAQTQIDLFSVTQIDQRIHKLQSPQERQIRRVEATVETKREGFMQTLLNAFDQNRDNQLSASEIRDIRKNKAYELAEHLGISKKEVTQVLKNLDKLGQLQSRQNPQDADPIILKPSKGTDFASGMTFLDDPADEILSSAPKKDPAKLKQALLSQADKIPALKELLPQLEKNQALTAQNLVLLQHIIQNHPADKVGAGIQKLNQWLSRPVQASDVIRKSERPPFVNALLRDLAFPEDINQGEKGTCAAASIQMELARKDPVKYIVLAMTLAQGNSYRLLDTPQGEVRRIYPNTSYRKDPTDERLLSSRLIQDSFMDIGHQNDPNSSNALIDGRLRFYDSRLSVDSAQGLDEKDALKQAARKHSDLRKLPQATLERLADGMEDEEMLYLAQGLFGEQWQDLAAKYKETYTVPNPDDPTKPEKKQRITDPDALMKEVDQALRLGRTLTIGSDDHAMLVTGTMQQNGKSVYVVSSWSGRYTMTPEALKQRLLSVFTEPLN